MRAPTFCLSIVTGLLGWLIIIMFIGAIDRRFVETRLMEDIQSMAQELQERPVEYIATAECGLNV